MSSENHEEVTALRELLAEQAERVGQLEGELADSQAELDEVCAHREALSKQVERLEAAHREDMAKLVKSEMDCVAAQDELARIRAERERAQARLCGHPSYGEGAVADGPGTPQASDLRELAEGVAGLVGRFQSLVSLSPTAAMLVNEASKQMRDAFSPPPPVDEEDIEAFIESELMLLDCGCERGHCICYTRR